MIIRSYKGLNNKCNYLPASNKGSAGVFMLLFMCVFIIAIGAVFQWQQVNTVKENLDRELSRAVNIAIDLSMLDKYRMDHISRIDKDTALNEFYLYLLDELQLDSDMKRYNEGQLVYQLVIDNTQISESPPEFSVEGRVIMKPLFFKDIIELDFEIPVKAKARNQRLE